MKKGIILIDYPIYTYLFCPIVDEYAKHLIRLDANTSNDDIKKCVEENDIRYIIIGYDMRYINNPLPDMGISVLFNGGDPGRRLNGDILKEIYMKNHCNGILTHNYCSIDPYRDYFSPSDIDVFHFKYCFDMEINTNYGLDKVFDVSNTGKFSRYEERRQIHSLFSNYEDLNYIRIRQNREEMKNRDGGIQYSKNINQGWFSLGGCMQPDDVGIYKGKSISDTFPKNIEIPASYSCLLTTEWGDREYLGFKDGVNCTIFKTSRDALRKVLRLLDDKDKLERITKAGYELVHKNHDVKKVVPDLIKRIEKKYL